MEASLVTLTEEDMIVWYKNFESYCSLHNITLLTYCQVTKGINLYPLDQILGNDLSHASSCKQQ
jgi:hypothetical protein